MKKFIKDRVLPFVCVFSILVSLCVPFASAASGYGSYQDRESWDVDSVEDWYQHLKATDHRPIDKLASYFGVDTEEPAVFFRIVEGVVGDRFGEITCEELERLAVQLNSWFGHISISELYDFIDVSVSYSKWTLATCFGLPNVDFQVVEGSPAGYYRIRDNISGLYVVNMGGMYPCAPIDGVTSEEEKSYQWIGEITAADRVKNGVEPVLLDELALTCNRLCDSGIPAQIKVLGTNYKCIWYNRQVYADSSGMPLVAWFEDDKAAVNQPRPDADLIINGEQVDVIEGNQTNLDLENMIMYLPDGTLNIIDKLIYDESTKTYHVESHDTYNYTTNNYYTWNYHINYTSITYIGQTEEYNKYYEVYYELPDGRSSADLTKEDLEQLNLSLDVLPYTRAVDDVSLKSLYHFDGDTRDSSYWNYKTDFTWNSGASVTYMDAAAFEGALYLDETAHDFTFTLPCFVGSEFTMQWRYYQSATPAPVTDSYLRFGGTTVLQFNGSQILTGSGVPVCVVPVGSWNEICLTGHGTSMYVYLNGVRVATYPSTGFHSNKVNFHFGSEQQTFKYFDEFRFLSKDLYGAGAAYTPTAVPHDTNLTLVLPDSENIVADEWIEWVGVSANSLVIDFTQGDAIDMRGLEFRTDGANFDATFELTDEGLLITRTDSSSGMVSSGASGLLISLETLLPKLNGYFEYKVYAPSTGVYVYSYVDAYLSQSNSGSDYVNVSTVNGPLAARKPASDERSNHYDLILYPSTSDSFCISRIEFVYVGGGGSSGRFATPIRHSTVSAIDSSSMHVPSLAVRTDLQITDYQIGGVRPSVPTKGLVWALVENQRIISIQIYNGQAWESCDGRIWTGERWIPASSYNIVTLQDMYDIVDATPDYEYIYTESGFWSWWQKSWNAFTEKFFSVFGSSGGVGGTVNPDKVPSAPDDETTEEDDSWSFLDLLIVLKDGTWKIITGVVTTAYDGFSGFVDSVSDAGNFFAVYDKDSDESIWFIPLEEGETVWD